MEKQKTKNNFYRRRRGSLLFLITTSTSILVCFKGLPSSAATLKYPTQVAYWNDVGFVEPDLYYKKALPTYLPKTSDPTHWGIIALGLFLIFLSIYLFLREKRMEFYYD